MTGETRSNQSYQKQRRRSVFTDAEELRPVTIASQVGYAVPQLIQQGQVRESQRGRSTANWGPEGGCIREQISCATSADQGLHPLCARMYADYTQCHGAGA